MDRIRTLLLARTNVVVMDPDLVASASTRPSRDVDVERLEDELAKLGYVMSLDLASMLRRLPLQTIQDVHGWLVDTLAPAAAPGVPLLDLASDSYTTYARRIASWLCSAPAHPCPWCGETKPVDALDPCGHLVCQSCWNSTGYSACPICHRRIAPGSPFIDLARPSEASRTRPLSIIHLAFDLLGTARQRFVGLLSRTTPLSPEDREELETVIDVLGPRIVAWLPADIPLRETSAIAIARLWLIAPDRAAIVRDTEAHVRSATDVLRIATVLMRGTEPRRDRGVRPGSLDSRKPMQVSTLPRGLRRAVLDSLERMPVEDVVEDMLKHARLWKRVGERLHPFELASVLPNTTLAFAIVRRTKLGAVSFGAALREHAVRVPFAYVEDDVIKPVAWAGPIEDALRAGNPRSALVRLTHRPADLLRRADHLVRLAQTRQVDALQTILKAIELAAVKGPTTAMLTLAAHVARRGRPWSRRVFFPRGEVMHAWGASDTRTPLRGDAIAVIVGSIRRQLCNRAEANRQFPRAVIDRALVDVVVPFHARSVPPGRIAWPRGSELALPEGQLLRLLLYWEQPAGKTLALDLSVALYDASWQHVATCDAGNLVVHARNDGRAAIHSGAVVDAPGGATEFVDLHVEQLAMLGARHAVMAVHGNPTASFDDMPHAFAGVLLAPGAGEAFDPRTVTERFDLRGRSAIAVPLTIDLAERRLRWLDVHVRARRELHEAGGYRAALAHLGRDFADLIGTHARPTMWDVACVHAAARANVVYIRERDGSFTMYRRRDNENKVTRLSRIMSGAADDGRVAAMPAADAPTWFALTTGMPLPRGSVGYALDVRGLPEAGVRHLAAGDLVGELAPLKR